MLRNEEWNIFQRIIETSHTVLPIIQYILLTTTADFLSRPWGRGWKFLGLEEVDIGGIFPSVPNCNIGNVAAAGRLDCARGQSHLEISANTPALPSNDVLQVGHQNPSGFGDHARLNIIDGRYAVWGVPAL